MHADEYRQKIAADGQQTAEGYDEHQRWQGKLMDWVNPGENAGMQTCALRLTQIEEEGSKRLDNDERLLRVVRTGEVLKYTQRLMQIEEEGSKRLDNDERLLRVMRMGKVLRPTGDDCQGLDLVTTDGNRRRLVDFRSKCRRRKTNQKNKQTNKNLNKQKPKQANI